MRNKTIIVFVIMLLHCFTPFAFNLSNNLHATNAESTTSRDANTDINVTQIEWIGPSYYCNQCVSNVLAPGFQEVRITVVNDGLLTGAGALTVFIDSGDGMGPVSIGSQSISLAPGGASQFVFS